MHTPTPLPDLSAMRARLVAASRQAHHRAFVFSASTVALAGCIPEEYVGDELGLVQRDDGSYTFSTFTSTIEEDGTGFLIGRRDVGVENTYSVEMTARSNEGDALGITFEDVADRLVLLQGSEIQGFESILVSGGRVEATEAMISSSVKEVAVADDGVVELRPQQFNDLDAVAGDDSGLVEIRVMNDSDARAMETILNEFVFQADTDRAVDVSGVSVSFTGREQYYGDLEELLELYVEGEKILENILVITTTDDGVISGTDGEVDIFRITGDDTPGFAIGNFELSEDADGINDMIDFSDFAPVSGFSDIDIDLNQDEDVVISASDDQFSGEIVLAGVGDDDLIVNNIMF